MGINSWLLVRPWHWLCSRWLACLFEAVGPVRATKIDFPLARVFFFFSVSYAAIIFTGNRQNSEGNVNSYLFFRYKCTKVCNFTCEIINSRRENNLVHYMFLGGQWVFWGASGFSDSLAPRASGCHSPMSRPAGINVKNQQFGVSPIDYYAPLIQ